MTTTHTQRDRRGFDYSQIVENLRIRVQEESQEIQELLAASTRNIVQIGLKLQLVRSQLKGREFQGWLRTEFCWSQATASNYMRTAQVFGELECLERFQPTALYVLARKKSTAARREAIDRARSGQTVTHRLAQALVKKHRKPEESPKGSEPSDPVGNVRRYLIRRMQDLDEVSRHRLADRLEELAEQMAAKESLVEVPVEASTAVVESETLELVGAAS